MLGVHSTCRVWPAQIDRMDSDSRDCNWFGTQGWLELRVKTAQLYRSDGKLQVFDNCIHCPKMLCFVVNFLRNDLLSFVQFKKGGKSYTRRRTATASRS